MTTRLPTPGPAATSPLPRPVAILRLAALTLMVTCVALPLVEILTTLLAGLSRSLLLAACLLAALEAHYSHYLVRRRHVAGIDALRFRLIEFGFYYLVLKTSHIALTGWPADLAAGRWPGDPIELLALLLDFETLVALLLAIGAAITVDDVLSDLDRVGEPPDRDRHSVSPLDSLSTRFFVGGGVILVLSGLARVGLMQVFNAERPPVTGLVANVLVYFILGFALLGQVRLALLTSIWQAQGTRIPPELPGRWVRYSLVFLGLTALLAFALPTGYTAGVIEWFGYVLAVILAVLWMIMAILSALCLLPVGWLMSLLGGDTSLRGPQIIPPPLPPPEALSAPALPPWFDTLRTVFVWVLVIGMMAYVTYNFLRDRPGLAHALRDLNALRRLRQLWAALRHRVSGLVATARASSAAAWLRERLRGRPTPAPWSYFRLGGATPAEQVRYYYLSLLRRTEQGGFGRRPPQTPHEYHPVLDLHLPDSATEIQTLTGAFEEARYSGHAVSTDQAAQVRAAWLRLRTALAQRAKNQKKDKGKGP